MVRKSQKLEEKRITDFFVKNIFGGEAEFINLENDPPDVYFKINDEYYVVEVVSYFAQQEIKDNYINNNDLEKCIGSEHFFATVAKKFGKKEMVWDGLRVNYFDIYELFSDIIKDIQYIKTIFADEYSFCYSMDSLIFEEYNSHINGRYHNLDIFEFLLILGKSFEDSNYFSIDLWIILERINDFPVSIKIKVFRTDQKISKVVDKSFAIWNNTAETINSVLSSIQDKQEKYDSYVQTLINIGLKYDKMILLVHPNEIALDDLNHNLFFALHGMERTKYDIIAIFHWEGIIYYKDNKWYRWVSSEVLNEMVEIGMFKV